MRAVILEGYGGPERLRTAQLPDPRPGPGQILVRAAASAVNPVDLEVRSGSAAANVSASFPMILGWDLSGEVVETGPGVSRFAVGDRVIAMSAQMATGVGTHAELVALDEAIAAHAPRGVSLRGAAALPLAGLTAAQALAVLDPSPGQTLLVTGAVGAVGGYAVQLATARGIEVVAYVRPQDTALAHELGAKQVATDGASLPTAACDLLLETAGVPEAISAVRDGGRAVSIVPSAKPEPERGIEVRMSFVEQDGAGLADLARLVEQGVLTLRVAEVFDYERAPEAHRRMAAGGTRGKLLVTP
ncbi:NADP-dependent oxidoreductase [Thermobifida halotolerans]|uniref:NADP-dependent oxidoreductase n=1 Tax=Thermobifida halotolerans TaxID=483545 RepID=A0A399FYX2_9ACTN|nr:NADP-dependent oxidoreductase [Thermobifida halotolerans]UOE18656.1 NADP-dependent oxidoreductase [Thermobifida halotolerans]